MKDSGKHPILANGQYYISPLDKRVGGGPIKLPHEYIEAKERLCKDIEKIQQTLKNDNEIFIESKVVCIRLEPKYEAKSYTPNSLIADSQMKLIGGRKYTIDEEEQIKGKLYFVKTTMEELQKLKNKFVSGQKDGVKKWKEQICTIKNIDLLQPEEKAMGFSNEWENGVVEVVIHPLGEDTNKAIDGFFETTKLDKKMSVIRTYDDGLTFVCTKMDRKTVKLAERYNPLRSLKPIDDNWEMEMRLSSLVAPAPQLPKKVEKSYIKIGVFDGGVKKGTCLLDSYVTNYDMVEEDAIVSAQDHAAGVCGAILYGTSLRGKKETDEVDNPLVSVESFRIFPTKKTGDVELDFQMYTTIDIVEEVVKDRKDIKLFNLSLGPKGAIVDDEINRFTYVCDKLTYEVDDGEVNPLFCVAVGNDGKMETPMNRVQSPSDMVNGLAIGAYTYSISGDKYRADYSCIGPGREGAKIKPDILEFGGSVEVPFITTKSGKEIMGIAGTSFATPVVSGKIGQLMALSENIVPHMGRTLLIHNADKDGIEENNENGFGFCPSDIDEILNCTDNKITILYEGEITSSATVKLPIFMPQINGISGMAKIRWTVCTIVNPNINDPDAYTNNCIEDIFYPNDMNFNFRKLDSNVTVNLLNDDGPKKARDLIEAGYIKSDLPVSKPAKRNFAEIDLRNGDFKWDTIIRKEINMRCSSLMNPFISLHAIGRDEYEHEKIKYFVAITVDVPKFKGSLYDEIVQKYNNLIPIQIRNINRIETQVK